MKKERGGPDSLVTGVRSSFVEVFCMGLKSRSHFCCNARWISIGNLSIQMEHWYTGTLTRYLTMLIFTMLLTKENVGRPKLHHSLWKSWDKGMWRRWEMPMWRFNVYHWRMRRFVVFFFLFWEVFFVYTIHLLQSVQYCLPTTGYSRQH